MKVDPLQQRIYRARKKGLSIRQIAVKEGLPLTTIYPLCGGPRFNRNLLRHREQEAIRRANNAASLNALVEARIQQISQNPEALEKLLSTARDIKDAVHAAACLDESAMEVLAEHVREAKQAEDPGVIEARRQLEARRKAAALNAPRSNTPDGD